MQLAPILSFVANSGGSPFDDMLRLIGVAAIVWAFFNGIRSLMSKSGGAGRPAEAPPVPVSSGSNEVRQDAGIPPEIVAVIAAAVHAVTGSKRRIVSIQKIDTSWEKAGRQSVLTSHRIR